MFKNDWFEGRQSIRDLPPECIADFRPRFRGEDGAVEYWVAKLSLDGPAWLIREHLSGYGAWDAGQLCDHQANLRRLLWTWASDCAERGPEAYPLYLMR
jgi:hypothetical protein